MLFLHRINSKYYKVDEIFDLFIRYDYLNSEQIV